VQQWPDNILVWRRYSSSHNYSVSFCQSGTIQGQAAPPEAPLCHEGM
jgi:hypothetical protein